MDDEFKELGLMNELETLIKEQNTFKIDILHNATRTMQSLDVQLSGLYQIEIPLSLSVGKNPMFKMSPSYIFKDLGFKTTFFYGGSGTWHKIDNYAISQGFDKIKFSTHIIDYVKKNGFKEPYESTWGAFDHHLYEFVKDYAVKNKDKKSLAVILTTSYHPPYDVPLKQFDIDYKKIDKFIDTRSKIRYDKATMRKIFAHIIYQNKIIADFVKKTSQALPNSLFIITGDHYDGEFPYEQMNMKSSNAVPLIIYSPILKPKVLANVGSHIDITPTITELVAPNAYKYASFGTPLLSNDYKKAFEKRNALGYKLVANERFLYDGFKIEYFKDKKPQNDDESLAKSLFENLKRAKALSWWIFKNGYIIKD